jgi:hypothetical protein
LTILELNSAGRAPRNTDRDDLDDERLDVIVLPQNFFSHKKAQKHKGVLPIFELFVLVRG